MVKIKTGKKVYNYEEDVLISAKIPKELRDTARSLFKKMKINQGKLFEELLKLIILRYKDGSLNASNGFITLNVLRSPIRK